MGRRIKSAEDTEGVEMAVDNGSQTLTVMGALDALLSGLVFVDKAHGVDSSVFRAICRRSGHEKGSTPCGITIAFFTG